MSHPTESLASYACTVADRDFPPLARSRAVDAIIDCLACALAGSREPLADKLVKALGTNGGQSMLIGRKGLAGEGDAALYNGAATHALDYDDTNHPGYAHVGAVVVPAMLAVLGRTQATGADLVSAFILGLEVIGKFGRAFNPNHMKRGWHPTSTFGSTAAAAVAGRLMRLNEREMAMAIGLAACATGGLRAAFGTMAKPLQAGYAARNGVVAALLAQQGFTAPEAVIEHKFGFGNVLTPGGCDFEQLLHWGEPLEITTDFGLALKPYPSCGATHPGIEAALLVREQIGSDSIERVRAGVSELAFEPLIYVHPKAPLEGKFSLHYCVAAALTQGEVNLATFAEPVFSDPKIHELIPRITMEADERVKDDPEFATAIAVETRSGKRHETLVPLAAGKPHRWFNEQQLLAKFLDCAQPMLGQRCEKSFSLLRAMDSAGSAQALLAESVGGV